MPGSILCWRSRAGGGLERAHESAQMAVLSARQGGTPSSRALAQRLPDQERVAYEKDSARCVGRVGFGRKLSPAEARVVEAYDELANAIGAGDFEVRNPVKAEAIVELDRSSVIARRLKQQARTQLEHREQCGNRQRDRGNAKQEAARRRRSCGQNCPKGRWKVYSAGEVTKVSQASRTPSAE